jgi:hypothetical protein
VTVTLMLTGDAMPPPPHPPAAARAALAREQRTKRET